MRPTVALLSLALLFTPALARAECRAAYTPDVLVTDIQAMQAAIPANDTATLVSTGKRVEESLVCLGRAAPPMIFASAYRLIGAAHLLGQADEVGARRWFRSALEIDASHDWDAMEVPLGHPLRAIYDAERDAAMSPIVRIEGKELVQAAGSTLTLDGRPLEAPAARLDRPHILQQVAADNSVRGSWKLEGNDFPDQFLRAVAAPTASKKAPKKDKNAEVVKAASDEGVARVVVQRVRPKEKTPLLLAGAAGLVGAGGVYALAWNARGEFDAATTTEQLLAAQDTTNMFVIASGGVFAVGMGIGYWGAILGADGVRHAATIPLAFTP